MLENCLSGSEGGGAFALPTPIFTPSPAPRRFRGEMGSRRPRFFGSNKRARASILRWFAKDIALE